MNPKHILFVAIIAAFITLVGCDENLNFFSEIHKTSETIEVFYIGGVPYLDKNADGEFETATTQMELEVLAANGTKIQIMNPGGMRP